MMTKSKPLEGLSPATRLVMAENMERIARRALIEFDPDDDRRRERIKAWEDEELARTATRH
jgi:hypothetical protein